MLRVLELFAGIGACSKALTNLGIEHEIVDAVEIDKYAIKSFNAIHGTNFEPQDITKWDKDIECDLIIHGSPCQDFSVAGKQAGGDKDSGTRSSLMYETLRIVEKLKPKCVIWENVKNLLSKKHRHNFDAYLEAMEKLGYKNYYQVLNAKHYGVPQNRERVFTVSILDDRDFTFPKPIKLKKKLNNVLEKKVDEKYYLSQEKADKLKFSNISKTVRASGRGSVDKHSWDIVKVGDLDIKGQDQIKRVYSSEGISPTLSTMQGGQRQPKIIDDTYGYDKQPREYNDVSPTLRSGRHGLKVAIKTANTKGYDLAQNGDGVDLAYPNSTTRRGRVGHEVAKTLECSGAMGTLQNYRIRKLTPKECWRLMGFSDDDFAKAEKVNSNAQLYKQAGNSIVVNVLEGILKNLYD